MTAGKVLRVGVLGCGNVGSAVVRLIADHADLIESRAGTAIEVAAITVRDLSRVRDVPATVVPAVFSTDNDAVVADPTIDVIVEVMGGVEPARTLILAAIAAGKPVVTGNKELLATHAQELLAAAETAGVDLLFEASVGGGIPLIRPLRESLAGDRILRVLGIVNGTTNFILTRMSEDGSSFADALAEAQRLGYAEADPTADVGGHDAAAKAAIVATVAFGAQVVSDDVPREGIEAITADDIASARDLGYAVKLLAIAEEAGGSVSVRVHPAMVPLAHPLASVRDSFNAIFIEGAAVGQLMLYGRGAGGNPTASAVLGDLIDAARNLVGGSRGATIGTLVRKPIRPSAEIEARFYVAMEVADRPGVLAQIAGVFGRHGVSIESVRQRGLEAEAKLTVVTHLAREGEITSVLEEIRKLDAVDGVTSVIRVIGDDA
jgi:homoserine dehydrogenase